VVLVGFVWFVIWGVGSAFLFAIGWYVTARLQGPADAADLANAWLFTFNGVFTGASGYGVVFFLCRERATLIAGLLSMFDVPPSLQYEFARHIQHVRRWPVAHPVAFLLVLIGGYISHGAGIPLRGFAHVYLSVAVMSFYVVGAYGLIVIIAIMNLFRFIELHTDASSAERISLRAPFRAQDVEAIDIFFITSAAMCVFAIYVCFRTTLTAFAGGPALFYKALVIPVFFFLPAALLYSFYPRYVLRQVWENDTFLAVARFATESSTEEPSDFKAALELRKLILDVREKMVAERRALPLLSFKDAPTLTMVIVMAIQLLVQRDPIIANFFGIGGK
jgi:hypothetical protein